MSRCHRAAESEEDDGEDDEGEQDAARVRGEG